MEDALASVWQRARLWDASCRALADSGAGSAPVDRPAADNRAQGGPEETKPSAAAGGDKPPPLHVENGDFYSAPFPVEAPGDGAVPFRHVFSALWHWSSGVIVAQSDCRLLRVRRVVRRWRGMREQHRFYALHVL